LRGVHIFWAAVVGVAIVLGAGAIAWLFTRPDDHSSWADVIRSTVLAVGAMAAVPAGYVAYRRQQTTEAVREDNLSTQKFAEAEAAVTKQIADQLEKQRRDELIQATARAEASAYRDRYAAAAAQLGHDKAAIRLAGAYALAQLADEWGRTEPDQRQTCIDVLCAYLRMPWPTTDTHDKADVYENQARILNEETRVRETIMRIIAAHVHKDRGDSWHQNDFDLTGATLPETRLSGAEFRGNFNASSAMFTRRPSFRGATFLKNARFDGATFAEDARFAEAKFTGNARFDGATFTENARFEGASFAGNARFDGAIFTGDAPMPLV
jgi:hypothetical protein